MFLIGFRVSDSFEFVFGSRFRLQGFRVPLSVF